MQNPQATTLRKGMRALGQGILEEAISREGHKGCSPILCTEPVSIEPPYAAFDSTSVLHSWKGQILDNLGVQSEQEVSARDVRTLQVFVSPEDVLSIGWMDSLLQALTPIGTVFAFELAGSNGKVSLRFGIPFHRSDVFRAALLGLFPAARIVADDRPFPESEPSAVEELVPVPPYHRTGSLLGQEGASPLGIVVGSIAGLAPESFGLFQVLLRPADPDHDWHYNIENLVESERRAKELELLGGLSSGFRYDGRVPPLMEPSAPEKVRRDVAFYAVIVRYAIWAEAEQQQQLLFDGMRSATSMVRFGNRSFRRIGNDILLRNLGKDAVRRMVVERLAHRPGLMVTSEEARARIMGARYLFYLLADSREGQIKEAEVTGTAPSSRPVDGNIRQGFVYERVPHITLKSVANNAEIDAIFEKWQDVLEQLRHKLNTSLKQSWQEWEIPREAEADWPKPIRELHAEWWKARIDRQQEGESPGGSQDLWH